MRVHPVLTLIPALVMMTGCEFDDMGDFSRYHEDFHYNYPLKSGGRVEVESFNGGIEISPWDQDTVDISGTRYARSRDAIADVKINIDHTTDMVSIRTSRPTTRNGNYGARFVIKVPRNAVLDRITTSNGAIRASDGAGPGRFRTSNGAIHVISFKGEVNAETSNGTLELTDVEGPVTGHTSNGAIRGKGLHGALDLTTSNGSVDLAFIGTPVPAIRARTSNSSITLRLPGDVNARLSANTSNGSISSDFEMMVRGEVSRHRMDGTLGSGGPLIDLQTSNGAIRILR
jgi:DUF4097 and DUF4098 domain-containing protein YvlB